MFFRDGTILDANFSYFNVIFRLHLEKAVFKLKCLQSERHNVYVISYTLMVSHFHEKRFPRICCDVITIVPIQNCEGFVLFVNCF